MPNILRIPGGGGIGKLPSDLAPLCPNFKVERTGGKVKISADKIQLNSLTSMVSGGVWAWGKTRPTKPTGENTKLWSRAELITTGKPYDGLYLGDVTPSDAVTETLIYLPENDSGSVKLVPFIVLSVDYLGGVAVTRKNAYGNVNVAWNKSEYTVYSETLIDSWISSTYLNSVISESVASQIVEADWPVLLDTGSVGSIKRKAVSLSGTEYGGSSGISDLASEGMAFPYFAVCVGRGLSRSSPGCHPIALPKEHPDPALSE